MCVQVGTQLSIVTTTYDGTRHHNKVHSAVVCNQEAERLPRQTLDSVTVNCSRQLLFGDGQAQAGDTLRLSLTRQYSEMSVGRFQRLVENSLKFGGIEQSPLTWEGMRQSIAPYSSGALVHFAECGRLERSAQNQPARRARPLARLALITLRPPRVAMRARKP